MSLYLLLSWFWNPVATQVTAMAAAATEDPVFWLANLGTAGIWVVCTMTGLQPTRAEVRRLDAEIGRLVEDSKRRDEKERARDQAVESLVSMMTTRTLPTLATAVAEIPQAGHSDPALANRLEDVLGRVERVLGDERSH